VHKGSSCVTVFASPDSQRPLRSRPVLGIVSRSGSGLGLGSGSGFGLRRVGVRVVGVPWSPLVFFELPRGPLLSLTSAGVVGVPSSEVPFLFEPPRDPLLSLRVLSGVTSSGVPFPPVAGVLKGTCISDVVDNMCGSKLHVSRRLMHQFEYCFLASYVSVYTTTKVLTVIGAIPSGVV